MNIEKPKVEILTGIDQYEKQWFRPVIQTSERTYTELKRYKSKDSAEKALLAVAKNVLNDRRVVVTEIDKGNDVEVKIKSANGQEVAYFECDKGLVDDIRQALSLLELPKAEA